MSNEMVYPNSTLDPPHNKATAPPSDHFCLSPTNTTSWLPTPLDPVVTTWIYLIGVVCLLGSVTNLVLLVTFHHVPSLRRGVGILINVVVANGFCLCAAVIPGQVYLVKLANHGLQPEHCRYCQSYMVIYPIFNNTANWFGALLAVNRLVAILAPTRYHYVKARWVQLTALAVCYGFTLLMAIPPAMDDSSVAYVRMSSLGNNGSLNLWAKKRKQL